MALEKRIVERPTLALMYQDFVGDAQLLGHRISIGGFALIFIMEKVANSIKAAQAE